MKKLLPLVLSLLLLGGCGTFFREPGFGTTAPVGAPPTAGEVESGYTYIPIDPFPVETVAGDSCREGRTAGARNLLDALPDNAVRMLVERFDASGEVSYLTAKAGVAGESYRVTVDYINADTINVPVAITKHMKLAGKDEYRAVNMFASSPPGYEPGSEIFEVTRIDLERGSTRGGNVTGVQFNIPVYVGVGLRVSANVHVVAASANIAGIGVIGAEAEADKLRGSLVVQTLGVNGKSVAAALPIHNELNRTTAQNAIVAVGSIKALLYADETIKLPRVVGLYLPFPGGKPLVNALISELSRKRVAWHRPCFS